jgi:hypothetical protein
MIELMPCPFCGGTNFDKYRFTRKGYLEIPAWLEERSPLGDWFRIECNGCGCTYDDHEDGLYDMFYDAHDFDIEFTEQDAWDMMAKIWNGRK